MILTLFSILFFFIFLQIFFKLYGDRLERTVETKYESTEVTLESQGGWRQESPWLGRKRGL